MAIASNKTEVGLEEIIISDHSISSDDVDLSLLKLAHLSGLMSLGFSLVLISKLLLFFNLLIKSSNLRDSDP